MKKVVMSVCGYLALFLLSPMVLASGGHDHSHWSSSYVHLIMVVAVLSVVIPAVSILKKRADTKKGQACKSDTPIESSSK